MAILVGVVVEQHVDQSALFGQLGQMFVLERLQAKKKRFKATNRSNQSIELTESSSTQSSDCVCRAAYNNLFHRSWNKDRVLTDD